MKYLLFLIMPLAYIILKITNITNIYILLAYVLYVLICFIIYCILFWGIKFFIRARSKPNDIILGALIGCFIDQGIKLIIYKTGVEINVLGKMFQLRQRKNMEQMALLNLFDIELNSYVIVMSKIAIVLIVLLVIWKSKMSSEEFKCALLLLLSASFATLLDSLFWGYTLDYFYFNKLVCYDFKDFYVDTAVSLILMNYFQNTKTNREIVYLK